MSKRRTFVRYNSKPLKKLGSNWKRPRGMHNKTRLKRKGHIKSPHIGHGSPKKSFGLYLSKFDYKIITSEKDLVNLEKKYVLLASNLGLKTKLRLLEKLKEMKITVLNVKNIDNFVTSSKEKLNTKKQQKKVEQKKKEDLVKEREKKAEEKEKKELTQEEITEKEELEKRKVLEKAK